jgi:histidine triad (HIT) family protein
MEPALPESKRPDRRVFAQLLANRRGEKLVLAGRAMSKSIFQKIIDREIPASIVYEDEQVLAFRDINAKAPVHVLIVPKKNIPRIAEATSDDHKLLGHLLLKAAEVAEKLGLSKSGYRLVINNGPDGGESVPHLHCHIMGGRPMAWPPG